MLASNVPDLEVDGWIRRRERDSRNVLSYRRDGLEVGVVGAVGGLYLLEQRSFAGIVEA